MSKSELHSDDSLSDPINILEQHLHAGFPADLALDLVLNEVVVRAAEATHASAAALALKRGDEMVCRAATGPLAPDLGVPLSTRDGLSGACLETRQPQLSVDTEFDPRIDPAVARDLGIRSILIVPVFDAKNKEQFEGVLEVFSPSPAAFSHNEQKLLELFAQECARIRHAAIGLGGAAPPSTILTERGVVEPEVDFLAPDPRLNEPLTGESSPGRTSGYEVWTLVLGSVAIIAIVAVSFLFGFRIGWLAPNERVAGNPVGEVAPNTSPSVAPAKTGVKALARNASPLKTPALGDELVIYEKGKVVFRMRPPLKVFDTTRKQVTSQKDVIRNNDAVVEASSTTKLPPAANDGTRTASPKVGDSKGASANQIVWLSPEQAEARLVNRTEPRYPPEALAAHRAGDVVLEVQVAEDGSVSSTRALSGDPVLAVGAAEAVQAWRYQPLRRHDRPTQFQTDVTLSFALPK